MVDSSSWLLHSLTLSPTRSLIRLISAVALLQASSCRSDLRPKLFDFVTLSPDAHDSWGPLRNGVKTSDDTIVILCCAILPENVLVIFFPTFAFMPLQGSVCMYQVSSKSRASFKCSAGSSMTIDRCPRNMTTIVKSGHCH